MELIFLGAVGTVTGSSYIVECDGFRVMVDCGMYQGSPELTERNFAPPKFSWSEIDAILLTHAHIDHSGLIPRAVKHGFNGPIYTHQATIDLCDIMLRDGAEIQIQDIAWLNRKRIRAGKEPVEPLYDLTDVENALKLFQPVKYDTRFQVTPSIFAEYRDAGHIIGSASIALDCSEAGYNRRIVFSGDIGHSPAPILKDPVGFESADALLIETTYGNREHESPDKKLTRLTEIIKQAHSSGGKIFIPSFAVGRTQELLYIIGELLHRNEIPSIPIYLDSPMAIRATQVTENHRECFDTETLQRIQKKDNPFSPPNLHIVSGIEQSMSLNTKRGPMIIIAGGGMCEGGRITHHLKHGLHDHNNHLVFVGYQAKGTTGRAILDGAKKLTLFGDQVAVNSKIHAIGAFSAHADRTGLTKWLSNFTEPPSISFMVHGEPDAAKSFAAHIEKHFGFRAFIPVLDQKIDLIEIIEKEPVAPDILPQELPEWDDIQTIISKIESSGAQFREELDRYAIDLGKRIQDAYIHARKPHWKLEEIRIALDELSKTIESEISSLKKL